jgi:hypothetical protein
MEAMIARIPRRLKPKGRFSCLGSVERALAQTSEHKRANRRDPRHPTEGGRDKRAQGAARSVGCFCFRFSLIRQCAASARNARAIVSALLNMAFPHIAEAGDG